MKKHGDLYNDGDPPFYYCGKCTMNHAVENAHCDGLREKPANGTFSWERPLVPTGVVPRAAPATSGFINVVRAVYRWQSTPGALVHPDLARAVAEKAADIRAGVEAANLPPPDPISQAVDDYLLMERKARAWDELRRNWQATGHGGLVDLMDSLVHPAQERA